MKYILFMLDQLPKLLIAVLMAAVLASSVSLPPKQAEAVSFDPIDFIYDTISSAYNMYQAAQAQYLAEKETWLDGVLYALTNVLLQEMTEEVVSWINSGFEGSPSFMQDFEGFLLGVADRTVGEYIWNDPDLNFLCSPFQLNLKYVLDTQYRKIRNGFGASQCTLTGMIGNLESFFAGDFIQGGWNDWFKVTMTPQYNPYGAMLLAQEQLTLRVEGANTQEMQTAAWGKGFLSREDCQVVENRSVCRTITPGTTIEDSLNVALGSPTRRIETADEINEIFGALFGQLVQQMFTGAGGLLGLTGDGGYAGGYYDDVANEPTGIGGNPNDNPIQQSINAETQYAAGQQSIIDAVDAAERYKDERYPPTTVTDPDTGVVTVVPNNCHSGVPPPEILAYRTTAQNGLAIANSNLGALNQIWSNYNSANGTPDAVSAQNDALQEYMTFRNTTTIHTSADVMIIGSDLSLLNQRIGQYQQQVDAACATAGAQA